MTKSMPEGLSLLFFSGQKVSWTPKVYTSLIKCNVSEILLFNIILTKFGQPCLNTSPTHHIPDTPTTFRHIPDTPLAPRMSWRLSWGLKWCPWRMVPGAQNWNLVCANNNRHTVLGTKNPSRHTISCTKTVSEASRAPETLRKRLFGGSGATWELHV